MDTKIDIVDGIYFENLGPSKKTLTGWYRPMTEYRVMEFPRGWRGVWVALLAALFPRRYERPRSPYTYTISLYAKSEAEPAGDEVDFVFGMQIEAGSQWWRKVEGKEVS